MHLVVLWFGAFKNARSTYAPTWVRADRRRFLRGETRQPDQPTGALASMRAPVLSVFSPALLAADRRAFAALTAHIAEADSDHRIIMIQVGNETGLLGDSRDRSPIARRAWEAAVPRGLLDHLIRHDPTIGPEVRSLWAAQGSPRKGTWPEVVGTSRQADEIFMAWAFARYVDGVAEGGRAV